jgi:hypothetical protein
VAFKALPDGGPMDIGGATLAAAAMRAGLIDEYVIVTHPVLVGGGTPFFTALDNWVNLNLVETRDVSQRCAPDQVRDQALKEVAPGDFSLSCWLHYPTFEASSLIERRWLLERARCWQRLVWPIAAR